MVKKYIIEIPDDQVNEFVGSTHLLMPYSMAGHKGHHDTGLPLTPYAAPDLEQVRKEAYEKGYNNGYEDTVKNYEDTCILVARAKDEGREEGRCEVWEAARKIIRMPEVDLLNLFTECYSAVCTSLQVFLKYDASECIEKIQQYEQEKEEIKVGDEVVSEDDIKAVVIDMDYYLLHVLDENGIVQGWPREDVAKTDRHFPEVAAVLKKMKEAQK